MEGTPAGCTGCWDGEQDPGRRTHGGSDGGGRDEDEVGQGGGVAEECQGRESGVMKKVS